LQKRQDVFFLQTNGSGVLSFSNSGGLSEADQWRINADIIGDAAPISTNLERNDTTGFGLLGTGMTQSSGIFTFPSTGYWYITAQFRFTSSATDNQKQGAIAVTINNSTYTQAAITTVNFYTNSTLGSGSTSFLFNVTSTANCKVRFDVSTTGGDTTSGDTLQNNTFFTFIKLA
jgi:hypothetical protein